MIQYNFTHQTLKILNSCFSCKRLRPKYLCFMLSCIRFHIWWDEMEFFNISPNLGIIETVWCDQCESCFCDQLSNVKMISLVQLMLCSPSPWCMATSESVQVCLQLSGNDNWWPAGQRFMVSRAWAPEHWALVTVELLLSSADTCPVSAPLGTSHHQNRFSNVGSPHTDRQPTSHRGLVTGNQ